MAKNKTESLTPILDDEDAGVHYTVMRQRWLQRQPEYATEDISWENVPPDIQERYYVERNEQAEIRTMVKWDTLSENSRRMQIESYNNTVDALDKMMHVMYDLQRPIPESIRKIVCKEFEW